MKSSKKKATNKRRVKEKKNLSIVNSGDYVTIKNRSILSASISAFIILGIMAAGIFSLKEAWDIPVFWAVFLLLIVGTLYSFANIIFGKIALDSPNKLMIVYNPLKKTYKFEDIGYIDVRESKTKEGNLYRVIAYMGEGKRSVEITSFSKEQADELVLLLRGMLDNGAMIYPEGDEEPFNFDDGKKKKTSVLFKQKKNEKQNNESSDTARSGEDALESTEKANVSDGKSSVSDEAISGSEAKSEDTTEETKTEEQP